MRAWLQTPRGRLTAIGLILLLFVLIRTAWVSDDAFTTLRVADNLWSGHGLRWNVADRVQVYTHPLWMMLLVVVSGIHAHFGAMALGAGLTLGLTSFLALRVARGTGGLVVLFTALLTSMGFIDFATSGLENPLAHVLLLGVWVCVTRMVRDDDPQMRMAVLLLSGLVVFNRLDHAVLVAPAVASALARRPFLDGLRGLAIGGIPLILWEIFSLVYYGFLLPNTAYAKLWTGVPKHEMIVQGLGYLRNAVLWDPVVPAVIALALGIAWRRRGPGDLEIGGGIVAWLLYVVNVGGDHMAGRFLTVAFVSAVYLVVRAVNERGLWVAAALGLLGTFARNPPLTSSVHHHIVDVDDYMIADERGVQYRVTGLIPTLLNGYPGKRHLAAQGIKDARNGPFTKRIFMVGFYGYYGGPNIHIVDPMGVTDPLLSHVPADLGPHRVGHYARWVPPTYTRVAREGGHFKDERLDSYWQDLLLVTRGPLFSSERWAAIWRLNTDTPDERILSWCSTWCTTLPEPRMAKLKERGYLPAEGVGVRTRGRVPRLVRVDHDGGRFEVRVVENDGTRLFETEVSGGPGVQTVKLPPVHGDLVRVVPAEGALVRVGGVSVDWVK